MCAVRLQRLDGICAAQRAHITQQVIEAHIVHRQQPSPRTSIPVEANHFQDVCHVRAVVHVARHLPWQATGTPQVSELAEERQCSAAHITTFVRSTFSMCLYGRDNTSTSALATSPRLRRRARSTAGCGPVRIDGGCDANADNTLANPRLDGRVAVFHTSEAAAVTSGTWMCAVPHDSRTTAQALGAPPAQGRRAVTTPSP
jgi:hypothetical protein